MRVELRENWEQHSHVLQHLGAQIDKLLGSFGPRPTT